jgi:hypothetical protein
MEKIKFNDIVGMLERDEMREITGGCGSSTGCGVASLPGIQLNEVIVYTNPSSYSPSLGVGFYGSYYNASNNNYGGSTNQPYNNYGGGGSQNGVNSQNGGSHAIPMTNLPTGDGNHPQVSNMCVFKNMEVVEKYFGKTLTQGNFVTNYALQYKIPDVTTVFTTGFKNTQAELKDFIKANFNTASCSTPLAIVAAVNNNQPVLAFLTNSVAPNGNIDGHEVTIVEYNQTTDLFRYYDSVTDHYLWGSGTSFSEAQAVFSPKN